MNPDLEKLVLLQRAEAELKRVQAELAEIPRLRAERDAGLDAERHRLDAAREALTGSQKNRRQKESELADLETRRSRYKGQLMEVKTNKEYQAMLHEIEGVEREIRSREDEILQEMESAETLQAEAKAEELVFKQAEQAHRADVQNLDARAAELQVQVARLGGERDTIAASLSGDILELFQRVAKLRGAGVAEARDEMCQQCHMKLRPQIFVDIKRNETIIQCPSCNRILYFEPPVPETAPQP
jgi:predicted  nucleic acid-binding Zn-ribbon protein